MSMAKDWLPTDLDHGTKMDQLFRLFRDLAEQVGWEVAETDSDDWRAMGLQATSEQLSQGIVVVTRQLRRAMKAEDFTRVAQWSWAVEQLAGLLCHVTSEAARERRGLN